MAEINDPAGLKSYLDSASGIPSPQKSLIWRTFYGAQDKSELTEALQQLPIPKNVKADLWDMYRESPPQSEPEQFDLSKSVPPPTQLEPRQAAILDSLPPVPESRRLPATSVLDRKLSIPDSIKLGASMSAPMAFTAMEVAGNTPMLPVSKLISDDKASGNKAAAAGKGLLRGIEEFTTPNNIAMIAAVPGLGSGFGSLMAAIRSKAGASAAKAISARVFEDSIKAAAGAWFVANGTKATIAGLQEAKRNYEDGDYNNMAENLGYSTVQALMTGLMTKEFGQAFKNASKQYRDDWNFFTKTKAAEQAAKPKVEGTPKPAPERLDVNEFLQVVDDDIAAATPKETKTPNNEAVSQTPVEGAQATEQHINSIRQEASKAGVNIDDPTITDHISTIKTEHPEANDLEALLGAIGRNEISKGEINVQTTDLVSEPVPSTGQIRTGEPASSGKDSASQAPVISSPVRLKNGGWAITALDSNGKQIGQVKFKVNENNRATGLDVKVDEAHRRQGVATALYDKIRTVSDIPAVGGVRTEQGKAFRKSYDERRGIKQPEVAHNDGSLARISTGTVNETSPWFHGSAKAGEHQFKTPLGDNIIQLSSSRSEASIYGSPTEYRTKPGGRVVTIEGTATQLANTLYSGKYKLAENDVAIVRTIGQDGSVMREDLWASPSALERVKNGPPDMAKKSKPPVPKTPPSLLPSTVREAAVKADYKEYIDTHKALDLEKNMTLQEFYEENKNLPRYKQRWRAAA